MILKYLWAVASATLLAGCAAFSGTPYPDSAQIGKLFPADAILLGEQHDAPDHQRIHRYMVETLAAQGTLAALTLEMASQGQSTEKLGPQADEEQVRAALQWNNGTWSWTTYGPVVMAAVRAGVPVYGANLAKDRLRETMNDTGFDMLLPGPALTVQHQRIRMGHCDLLPESQVAPMARIQIARDISMAQTAVKLVQPGKTVLLLAGGSHVARSVGIPQHLPPEFIARTVLLHGETLPDAAKNFAEFDQFWPTRPAPPVDHCADFAAHRAKPASAAKPDKTP